MAPRRAMGLGFGVWAGAALLLWLSAPKESAAGFLSSSASNLPDDSPQVGAYYFNWYNIEGQWKTAHKRTPKLGEYEITDKNVMVQHHTWAKQGGIDFFGMLWMGISSDEFESKLADEIDQRISAHLDLEDALPVALVYNPRVALQAEKSDGKIDLSAEGACEIVMDHFSHAATKHFMKPNYLKREGDPVLFIYTHRDFVNYEECLNLVMERVVLMTGRRPYIVADVVWWSPAPENFDWAGLERINASAVTAYNLYDPAQGSKMGSSFAWHNAQLFHDVVGPAWTKKIMVVPSIVPGFDDRQVQGRGRPIIERDGGAEMVHQWKQLLWMTKCQPMLMRIVPPVNVKSMSMGRIEPQRAKNAYRPMIMINSFNQWHEDTAIEPSQENQEQFLKLLSALKAEMPRESVPCAMEKDAKHKPTKYVMPKNYQRGVRTPGDDAWIQGVRFVGFFFVMWVIWVVGGPSIMTLTGTAPDKLKDDDLDLGDFGSAKKKAPKRAATVFTWILLASVGICVYYILWFIFEIKVIHDFFNSRYTEYNMYKQQSLRVARKAAVGLCPQLSLSLHQDKFEDWVVRLAEGQITQQDFREAICGDKPLHRREIEQLFLDIVGKEGEEQDVEQYVQEVEEGKISLADVQESLVHSPEAQEHAQYVQSQMAKIPREKYKIVKGLKDALDKAKEGALAQNKEELLGAMELLNARVKQAEASGEFEGAAKMLREFFEAQRTGRRRETNRKRRRRQKEEESKEERLQAKRESKGEAKAFAADSGN